MERALRVRAMIRGDHLGVDRGENDVRRDASAADDQVHLQIREKNPLGARKRAFANFFGILA